MGRHKRRMKGIDKNNQDEHEEALTLRQKATRFAFLVLYTGVGYSIACLLFLFNDIVPPSKQQNSTPLIANFSHSTQIHCSSR